MNPKTIFSITTKAEEENFVDHLSKAYATNEAGHNNVKRIAVRVKALLNEGRESDANKESNKSDEGNRS